MCAEINKTDLEENIDIVSVFQDNKFIWFSLQETSPLLHIMEQTYLQPTRIYLSIQEAFKLTFILQNTIPHFYVYFISYLLLGHWTFSQPHCMESLLKYNKSQIDWVRYCSPKWNVRTLETTDSISWQPSSKIRSGRSTTLWVMWYNWKCNIHIVTRNKFKLIHVKTRVSQKVTRLLKKSTLIVNILKRN